MNRFKSKSQQMALGVLLPSIALLVFLLLWQLLATATKSDAGSLPGPADVFEASKSLLNEYLEQQAAKDAFYQSQPVGSDALFSGPPTFFSQILTSLKTVLTACLLSSIVAIPLGLMCGLSPNLYRALNPLIQIFKPISPLAWLPIVSVIVGAVYITPNDNLPKSFVISAVTVAMCTIWPTLINTMVGVGQVNQDFINVSRVLNLPWYTNLTKIVLPAATPMIFTGLRLAVGVGWMVLIAAEMLAQNPGLGKFVWDEFQNGSSQSTARIFVAVFTIGLIGFALDRIMLMLQRYFSWDKSQAIR
jgi:nitrate/nitrite transport system permease protein